VLACVAHTKGSRASIGLSDGAGFFKTKISLSAANRMPDDLC
jgi:hypothetical protein